MAALSLSWNFEVRLQLDSARAWGQCLVSKAPQFSHIGHGAFFYSLVQLPFNHLPDGIWLGEA